MAALVSYAVDVSSHQDSHQNWTGFGVHMGIAKASEGRHSRDEWFVRHMADIKAAGLVPGAYHFAWPNQDVAAEAANYVAAVRPVNRADLVHILDLEPYPDGAKNYVGRSDAQIKAWSNAWVAAVRKAFPGQRVLAYTPRDSYTRHFPAGTDGYWYPAYPVQGRSFATAGKLARPVVGGKSVWGWQFASVPRDQTVIYMSPTALRTWAAGSAPTVQEDDVQLTDKITIKKSAWNAAPVTATVGDLIGFNNLKAEATYKVAAKTLAATVANTAAITALAKALGDAHDGVDTDQLLAKLVPAVTTAIDTAVEAAVIKVDVSVGDNTKEN
jgi:GH25 family lysozyme M1 (1,4-beta-N-acetylmuramidase)